jgi:hypothetical protein
VPYTHKAIWELLRDSAMELTRTGQTPFTRDDLISSVQRKRPDCPDNSINPIIQGITDNLRGGASGAVGKNILHSVSRGQFILQYQVSSTSDATKPTTQRKVLPKKQKPKAPQLPIKSGDEPKLLIGKYSFLQVTEISPLVDVNDTIIPHRPQSRYLNEEQIPLNKYGKGPYCKFKIPNNYKMSGVYAITVDGAVKYIGECVDLSSRYNMGYGNISPRNCYVGGQETNCRINNLIYEEAVNSKPVVLWFYQTMEYKEVEDELRSNQSLDWNRV